jgi:hypothetical protein
VVIEICFLKERIRRHRRYVYEAGSLNQPEKGSVKVIADKVLEKEGSKEFEEIGGQSLNSELKANKSVKNG